MPQVLRNYANVRLRVLVSLPWDSFSCQAIQAQQVLSTFRRQVPIFCAQTSLLLASARSENSADLNNVSTQSSGSK